ncbi:DUF192 domain-containing protein [Patescibacteria group bacterium]|nr:MAG: DUF192 domain-containing protein [Patescibacteria group bacterium]
MWGALLFLEKEMQQSIWKTIEVLVLTFVLLSIAFSLIFFLTQIKPPKQNRAALLNTDFSRPLRVGSAVVWADIAETEKERVLGFSGVSDILDNQGLLFVFPEPRPVGIWMKNMLFSIDVLWLDEEWRVIQIETRLVPEGFPKIFTGATPARYVLELKSGFVEREGTSVGDRISPL